MRLELSDLHVRYGNVEVLHGIGLRVEPGEIVTLLGANGAGKSTTLMAISGLVRPTAGSIRFGDREVPLDRLVALFGERARVRLREGYTVRGKPLVFEGWADAPKPRIILEHPRRNPETGNIEELQ